jgi:hypothetical protein
MKQRFKTSPCLGKKGLSTEERTKLFWPLVARDFERQALQTGSVSTRQNYSPAVSRRSVSRQDGRGGLQQLVTLDNRLALLFGDNASVARLSIFGFHIPFLLSSQRTPRDFTS